MSDPTEKSMDSKHAVEEALAAARERLMRGFETKTMTWDTNTTNEGSSTMAYVNSPSPSVNAAPTESEWQLIMRKTALSRRRQVGDTPKDGIDVGGYWIHIETDAAGIPKSAALIVVNPDLSEWCYIGETETKLFERLPKRGFYVYLY